MKLFKLVRNHFALFFLAALAVSGVAYLVWAVGANVNCIAGTCSSTNGNQDTTSPYDSTTVFTGENDTASIEAVGSGTSCTNNIFQLGGGTDVAYILDPQTASKEPIQVQGESGDDVILDGSTANNCLLGNDGNDFIAEDAVGILVGGNGNDLLAGGRDNDVLGDTDLNGTCAANESDPNNDVFTGGPGNDTYCTADNDGDDIVIIHAGDVPANNNEDYTCEGNDTILLFGFNLDLVQTKLPTETTGNFYNLTAAPAGLAGNQVAVGDPVNNPTGSNTGARYTFTANNTGAATGTCNIIAVE